MGSVVAVLCNDGTVNPWAELADMATSKSVVSLVMAQRSKSSASSVSQFVQYRNSELFRHVSCGPRLPAAQNDDGDALVVPPARPSVRPSVRREALITHRVPCPSAGVVPTLLSASPRLLYGDCGSELDVGTGGRLLSLFDVTLD